MTSQVHGRAAPTGNQNNPMDSTVIPINRQLQTDLLAETFSGATFDAYGSNYLYSVEIGPGGQFKQDYRKVGTFSHFNGKFAEYTGGDLCGGSLPRSGRVTFVEDCSTTSITVEVTEPSTCYYLMMVGVCPTHVSGISFGIIICIL